MGRILPEKPSQLSVGNGLACSVYRSRGLLVNAHRTCNTRLRPESFLPLPLGEVARQSRDGEGIWWIRREAVSCWLVLLQLPPPLRGTSLGEGGIDWGGFADSPGGWWLLLAATAPSQPLRRQLPQRGSQGWCGFAGGLVVTGRFYRRAGHDPPLRPCDKRCADSP